MDRLITGAEKKQENALCNLSADRTSGAKQTSSKHFCLNGLLLKNRHLPKHAFVYLRKQRPRKLWFGFGRTHTPE